jgi:hypothetical protein
MGYDETTERAYLQAGLEPPWVRVWRDGKDVTEEPTEWTEEDRERRASWITRRDVYER